MKHMPELTAQDQRLLARVQRKIDRIRQDPRHSRGLIPAEVDVAARANLINHDQRWWWTEQWQRGERQVDHEPRSGRTRVFDTVKDLIKDLRSQ